MEISQGRSADKNDAQLLGLEIQLRQTISRAKRQRQRLAAASHPSAWVGTLDEAISLVTKIGSMPAHGLPGIAVKLSALRWMLEETDAVLDLSALRQLRALDREVARLARS